MLFEGNQAQISQFNFHKQSEAYSKHVQELINYNIHLRSTTITMYNVVVTINHSFCQSK